MKIIQDHRRKVQLIKLLEKLPVNDLSRVRWDLLDIALTHPSISPKYNYEQLEFLGDAVIRLSCGELLMEMYPHWSVGEYAAVRSVLVSDRFLAEIAERYGFENYLLTTQAVSRDRWGKSSRLADCFEGVLGALYQSTKDMSLIRNWLDPILAEKAVQVHADPARQNYKDALQEWSQGKYKSLPIYKVTQNPAYASDNDRFIAEVWLQDKLLGEGKGATKKESQQAAAKQAYETIMGGMEWKIENHRSSELKP